MQFKKVRMVWNDFRDGDKVSWGQILWVRVQNSGERQEIVFELLNKEKEFYNEICNLSWSNEGDTKSGF